MNLMIKPKYQYILLPFHYALIAFIAIINYIQMKKYKQACIIATMVISISVIMGLIIFEIIIENFNMVICGISTRTLYIETLNIGIGYLLIRNQKKNIEFN
ncbi:hypothetical protein [Clostridium sp. VAP51]|uniref:hypothetical protein n=1 Tax=Clostridium sp. VAP51 TaxID=2949978 RepID=UPI00207A66CF|nr:hypothetical protein [Clostridium sp. VAP51]